MQPLTIVVVHDDALFLEVTGRLLTRAGYQVSTTLPGSAAYATIEREQPSLLIVEMQQAGSPVTEWGFEALLQTPALANCAILDLLLCSSEGVCAVIQPSAGKQRRYNVLRMPFAPAELLATVKRMIGTRSTHDAGRR